MYRIHNKNITVVVSVNCPNLVSSFAVEFYSNVEKLVHFAFNLLQSQFKPVECAIVWNNSFVLKKKDI